MAMINQYTNANNDSILDQLKNLSFKENEN